MGTVELRSDGTVEVRSGLMELGTGATQGIAQFTADVLGTRLEDVKIVASDTQEAPFTFTTSGRRPSCWRAARSIVLPRSSEATWQIWRPSCSASSPRAYDLQAGRWPAESGMALSRLAALAKEEASS